MKNTFLLSLCAASLYASACDSPDLTTGSPDDAAQIDVIGLSERPASLLVVDQTDNAARRRFERTLEQMGGSVIATLPPRLVIAQVPAGADAALARVGLVARFDRAVGDADLAGATSAESRFLAVYSNRWQADVPAAEKIVAFYTEPALGEPFEAAPKAGPQPGPQPDPEDSVSIPYASGTVVVSIVLPESNGSIDPSTEDWNEERIREIYLKVQAALDGIASAEPNAKLRYILHYESAPAAGGLEGTVDSDYEFGQRAQWTDWANESLATANVLSRLVGHAVTADEVWTAATEYQLALRKRYDADAAYFFLVAADHNYTASLRAHAWIGGPWTVLESQNGSEVFAHETGHIFGAQDEYCPDACVQPTALTGYLGAINANAEYRATTEIGSGINRGHGEGATSLMQYNDVASINGYTRAAWGWLDIDGDGIVDVRDTFPKSALTAAVTGQTVRLTGQVIDRPASALWRTPYSMNRIVGLEIELWRGGVLRDVLDVALPGDTRGRQAVDVTLPKLRAGSWSLRVRAKNDVGNVEPTALVIAATTTGTTGTAPIAHLELADVLSSGASHPIHAYAVDLDGDTSKVRIDLGGDGSYDTGWATTHDLDVTPPAGLWAVVVQARDPSGRTSTRRVEVPVFAGDAPPSVVLGATPGLVHGTHSANVALSANANDPEGGTAELDWIARLATNDGSFKATSGWGAPSAMSFTLPTPERLVVKPIDLAAGDSDLANTGWVRDVLPLDATTLALAGGTNGIWFVDISSGAAVLRSRLDLETIANKLWRDGNRLYVLGTQLTVVDITNVDAPVEIKQILATTGTRIASLVESTAIPETADWGAAHYVNVQDGERITSTKVTLWINHPRPAQLKITLFPPKQHGVAPIVLRDHSPGPGGLRKYTYTVHDVDGQFASDGWSVEVRDDVIDGQIGTLESTEIKLATRGRGAKVIIDPAKIVGKVAGGRLIIAGGGLQALDVSLPFFILPVSSITGAGTYDATLVGNKVIVAMPLESKHVVDPVLRGLCAVDFTRAWAPVVIRVEDELGAFADQIARVGNRMYLHMVGLGEERFDYTVIGSPSTFVGGGNNWDLAHTELRVDPRAFGDENTLWTTGDTGAVMHYDVSDVNNVRVLDSYPQSYAGAIIRLDSADNVLLFQFGTQAELANLHEVHSTLSRTYQVAVEARDDAGGVGRAYRTVHVIPYDHAPVISSVTQTSGNLAGELFAFHLMLNDPDAGRTWDPNLLLRADWDGDGIFDSDWQFFSNNPDAPWDMTNVYDRPGTYQAVFEVRDGFWATGRFVQEVAVH